MEHSEGPMDTVSSKLESVIIYNYSLPVVGVVDKKGMLPLLKCYSVDRFHTVPDIFIVANNYTNTASLICTMDLFTTLLISLLCAYLIKWWLKSDPPKINGVYSQPNKFYWLKYAVFRLILWLRKCQQHREVSGKSAGLGRKSRNSPEEMDTIQVLPSEHPTVSVAVLKCTWKYVQNWKITKGTLTGCQLIRYGVKAYLSPCDFVWYCPEVIIIKN